MRSYRCGLCDNMLLRWCSTWWCSTSAAPCSLCGTLSYIRTHKHTCCCWPLHAEGVPPAGDVEPRWRGGDHRVGQLHPVGQVGIICRREGGRSMHAGAVGARQHREMTSIRQYSSQWASMASTKRGPRKLCVQESASRICHLCTSPPSPLGTYRLAAVPHTHTHAHAHTPYTHSHIVPGSAGTAPSCVSTKRVPGSYSGAGRPCAATASALALRYTPVYRMTGTPSSGSSSTVPACMHMYVVLMYGCVLCIQERQPDLRSCTHGGARSWQKQGEDKPVLLCMCACVCPSTPVPAASACSTHTSMRGLRATAPLT